MIFLEPGLGSDLLEEYITEYVSKGNNNSNSHNVMVNEVMNVFFSCTYNSSKIVKSAIRNHLNLTSSIDSDSKN